MVRLRKSYLCAKVHSRAHVRYGSLADMTASNPDVCSYPESEHWLAYDLSVAKPDPIPANDRRVIAGQAVYKDNCAACHTDAGTGTPHPFRALTTTAVRSDDATTLIHITLEGSRAVSTAALPTAPAMPAFGWRLNDEQIASVLTFIRNTWGNSASMVSTDTVRKLRQSLAAGRQ
jgi:mono/diheme cytochrome c family protein